MLNCNMTTCNRFNDLKFTLLEKNLNCMEESQWDAMTECKLQMYDYLIIKGTHSSIKSE